MLNRFLDQPLFININQLADKASSAWDWLKNKGQQKAQQFGEIVNPKEQSLGEWLNPISTAREISAGMKEKVFEPLKRAEEKIGQYEVPFLPESSPLRYLPGKLGEETGKGLLPQNLAQAAMFAVPLGTLGKVASKLPVGKQVAKVATKELGEVAPRIFKGFADLSTKVLEKLKGRTTVSKQFISDLTNAPDLKQVERDLIRNVLDSYEGNKFNLTGNLKIINGTNMNGGNLNAEWVKLYPKDKNIGGPFWQPGSPNWKYVTIKDNGKLVAGATLDEVGLGAVDLVSIGSYRHNAGRELVSELKNKYDTILVNPVTTESGRALFRDSGFKEISENNFIWEKGVKVSDQIPVAEFADKVKQELLPLKRVKQSMKGTEFETISGSGGRYENISLPTELRGNVANYFENIYESPIKTSAGETHFGNVSKNYFGHTRIEDMADIKVKLGKGVIPPPSTTHLGLPAGGTRRVIEVQSDLYQKGALEREKLVFPKSYAYGETKSPRRLAEVQKLQQYNDPTAHFRMVREEVKQAAIDGKTKLQFPTGETAMKIEGLGERPRPWITQINGRSFDLTPERLRIGDEIYENRVNPDKWIITDILENGKFKAVPKENWESIQKFKSDKIIQNGEQLANNELNRTQETFDISGKVDTSNPIFRFYEKDLGSYLRNKFGAKQITDNKGVTWWELDIKPEQGKAPIEAFGALPLFIPQKDEDKQRIQFLQK